MFHSDASRPATINAGLACAGATAAAIAVRSLTLKVPFAVQESLIDCGAYCITMAPNRARSAALGAAAAAAAVAAE